MSGGDVPSSATPPVVLTISGSDSSGGAGIQADLATFAAHGVHGASAVTALTAQNTVGVHEVVVTPLAAVRSQIRAVLDDLPVAAVKTGMLARREIVELVAELAGAGELPNLVVDPVMVSSTGDRLLDPGAEQAYREALLPRALVATPNLREASVLARLELASARDVIARSAELSELCPGGWVVVTGGHAPGPEAVDVVLHAGEHWQMKAEWIETRNDHGTGCTFASSVASRLALGEDPRSAIQGAKAFVATQVRRSAGWALGAGRGPVAHIL